MQAVCVLKIFMGTVKPLLEDLGQWLEDAALPSAHDDFFIYKGELAPLLFQYREAVAQMWVS